MITPSLYFRHFRASGEFVSASSKSALRSQGRIWRQLSLLFASSMVMVCVAFAGLVFAQQKQEEPKVPEQKPEKPQLPFIEHSELPHKLAVAAFLETQPQQHGRWVTLPILMPINPVHVALMHTGKVLVISGSGNDPDNKTLEAAVWEPRNDTVRTFRIAWDMFCNGMVVLPDGRPFVLGGTLKYDIFLGYPRTSAFSPSTELFANMPSMGSGRWYPTGTVLGNGSVMVLSGLNDADGGVNTSVQIWNGATWTAAGTVFDGVPLYPREHLLPNGKVFESGANPNSQMFDPSANSWTAVATTLFGRSRDYGTSILLPLTPGNGYRPKVMILGGGDLGSAPDATNTTELIDLSVPNPQWVQGPPMSNPRVQLNATILPDGKVLISGGSARNEDGTTASLRSEIYAPDTNAFTPASSMEFPRLYHSNTLLLPNATVMAVGSNPERKVFDPHVEIYEPPYLFDSNGAPARRPAITQVRSDRIRYGGSFLVHSPDAANIRSVVLVRPGAVTHAFDMEQRLVGLSFKARYGVLHVTGPATSNLAPPGYYLLFIVNASGVPSVGRFVRLGDSGRYTY